MKLGTRFVAASLASIVLIASQAAFAATDNSATNENHAVAFDVSTLAGRVVVDGNGRLLGVIYQTQQDPGGAGQVYLFTTSNVGLDGKIVTLPATMFASQRATPSFTVLKAPTLTTDELRKMPAAMGAPSWPT